MSDRRGIQQLIQRDHDRRIFSMVDDTIRTLAENRRRIVVAILETLPPAEEAQVRLGCAVRAVVTETPASSALELRVEDGEWHDVGGSVKGENINEVRDALKTCFPYWDWGFARG